MKCKCCIRYSLFTFHVLNDCFKLIRSEGFPKPIAAHPGALAFGVTAAVAFDEFYGLLAGNTACKIIKQFLIAYGLQGIQMALWIQAARLSIQARAKHLINPLIDALV